MARPAMKSWNFRAPEYVWKDAIATANAAGENLPDRLREFLEWYGQQPYAREPRRPDTAVRDTSIDHPYPVEDPERAG